MSLILAAFDWQTAVVAALVGVATIYLARRYWKAWTSDKRACGGGCGTCSAKVPLPLVTFDPTKPTSHGAINGGQKKASGTD